MKLFKCISLFVLYPALMFGLGFAANMAFMEYFYPGEQTGAVTTPQLPEVSEPVAVVEKKVVNADTDFTVQKYDTELGLLSEEKLPVPDMYIGMTREDLQKEIRMLNDNLTLEDQEAGVSYMELYSFSPQRVVIRKCIEPKEEEGFFLVNENHCVVVYQNDLQNVYLTTDIKVDELPEELRGEILSIKYIENEKELYNFLESYSS